MSASKSVYPLLAVYVNGKLDSNAKSADVSVFNNYRSGTFSVQIVCPTIADFNSWTNQTAVQLDVRMGFSGSTLAPLIVGDVDSIDFDIRTMTVTCSGRDLSAKLIDSKTADLYQNLTSSEIITQLCADLGNDSNGQPILTPVVTSTSTIVGQYYAYDHVRTAMGGFAKTLTKWDLATYLAQNEDYDLFVQGKSLYFQPKSTGTNPYKLTYAPGTVPTADMINLHMSRSLTIAKGVAVTVKSWSSAYKRAIIEKSGSTDEEGQTYVIYKPNLTIKQAQQLAQTRLAQITKFEKTIEVDLPGEVTLTPRDTLSLTGTGTAFDQLYYPDEIHRSISFDGGFTETIRGLNHPPVNETSAVATGGPGAYGL